jgi:16S rRNA (guanine527-N7)-methyltransferase
MVAVMDASVRTQLEEGAANLGLALVSGQVDRLLQFSALLKKWNRTYNLTAIEDDLTIVSAHLLDSLVLAMYIERGRVLDVGTGGGFPGIPLAIARHAVQVTLLDPLQKRAAFLRQAIAELELDNAEVACSRVEDWRDKPRFDVIVSRAFAELAVFVSSSAHLLKPGGSFIAMKGVLPQDEMDALPAGFRVTGVQRVPVPGLEAERHLIFMERQ